MSSLPLKSIALKALSEIRYMPWSLTDTHRISPFAMIVVSLFRCDPTVVVVDLSVTKLVIYFGIQ